MSWSYTSQNVPRPPAAKLGRRWRPKSRPCTRFLGPLTPGSALQAAHWLGRKLRIKLGFETVLERQDDGIYVRQGGITLRGWTDAVPPRTTRIVKA